MPNPTIHQFIPYNNGNSRTKPPSRSQPRSGRNLSPILHWFEGRRLVYYLRIRRRREKIIKNTPDKDLNDDDFFWVSGNFEDHQAQIPGRSINWKKGTPGIITSVFLHALLYFGFKYSAELTVVFICWFCPPPFSIQLPKSSDLVRRTTVSRT